MRVSQPVSLSTTDFRVGGQNAPAQQNQRRVVQQPNGVGRGQRTKDQWDRFASRTRQGFKHFREISLSHAKTANRRADRFNLRLEKFSGRVGELVDKLKNGNCDDLKNADFMATLRHDVKLLHQDQPWADREQIFSARLDIELGELSREEVEGLEKALKNVDQSNLTSRDKRDLQTIQRAVIRQIFAQSKAVGKLLREINSDTPSDIAKSEDIMDRLDRLATRIKGRVDGSQLSDRHGELNEDILAGAIRLRLQKENPGADKLGGMNRNLLNVEYGLRETLCKKNTVINDIEVLTEKPALRLLSREVRALFLRGKAGDFTDARLISRMKVLGSGAAHEVTKGRYDTGNGAQVVSKVHKYDDEVVFSKRGHHFPAVTNIGIDSSNPRLLERAVFTSKYAEKLGFDICVKTDFSYHRDQLGVVMDLADGQTSADIWGFSGLSERPSLQSEMIKLQLLDVLTGQTDRHKGNYMIHERNNGSIQIRAIDSDFCMGPLHKDPTEVVGKSGVHLTHLPPVVDSDMADAIHSIEAEDIDALGDNMFDDETIKSAKKRLSELKRHLSTLEQTARIIDPGEWGSAKITKILKETRVAGKDTEGGDVNFNTSYWQRDRGHFEGENINW